MLVLTASLFLCGAASASPPPASAYGALPAVRLMALSPDGERLAFVGTVANGDALLIYRLGDGIESSVGLGEAKIHDVRFLGGDHVILVTSETARLWGRTSKFEFSAAFAYGLETGKVVQLLDERSNLYPAQSGLGRIVGVLADSGEALMPAYIGGRGGDPRYDLLRVDLDSGRGRPYMKGTTHTIDWFVDATGTVIAREEYDNRGNVYRIQVPDGRDWRDVRRIDTDVPSFEIFGSRANGQLLIVRDSTLSNQFTTLAELGMDGLVSEPILTRDDTDIDQVLVDSHRQVFGVAYTGMLPSYEFFDPGLHRAFERITNAYPKVAIDLVSWSDDFSRLLLRIFDGHSVEMFSVFDVAAGKAIETVATRRDMPPEAVGEFAAIEYRAADGLRIPAVLTWPPGIEPRENLPLVVMPHGGPAAYDRVRFDWMAQFVASRGYVVLQPNFRGSAGFGWPFRMAGRGEWGRKMQTDLADGVDALVRMGAVDPERVCIVGASYGGYAALAGGAFDTDRYRCIAAIAGVSDLKRMLDYSRRLYGARHWIVDYWQDELGEPASERDALRAISPAFHAERFAAPVLLIHGRDDTIVPLDQSRVMEKALKKAGKDVSLVRLRGGDHWLSDSETRTQALQELESFLRAHLPTMPDNMPQMTDDAP